MYKRCLLQTGERSQFPDEEHAVLIHLSEVLKKATMVNHGIQLRGNSDMSRYFKT